MDCLTVLVSCGYTMYLSKSLVQNDTFIIHWEQEKQDILYEERQLVFFLNISVSSS